MNTPASTSVRIYPPSNKTVANPKGELKAITTRSGLVLDGPTVPMPPPFINPEEDGRVEETFTDPEHGEFTIKVPPPLVQKANKKFCDSSNELKCKALADLGASINLMPLSVWKELGLPELISTQMTLELANRDICTPKGIARDVFVPVGKFTFPADFVIVDYESDPRVPLILGRPFLRTARALIDVHGEEMILRDGNERLILNMRNDTSSYSNEPHQESINMIDVYNVSHEDYREDLFATNHPSGNPTSPFSSYTDLTSPEVNDDIFDPEEDIIKNLLNLDKTKDLPPYHDNQLSGNPTPISEPETKSSSSSPTLISLEESDLIWEEFKAYLASDSFPPGNSNPSSLLPPFHNSLSGSTTSSSPSLHISETSDYFLEEFADELAHITFPPGNDDLPFDAESNLRELEYLLNHDPIKDMDSILEDSDDYDDKLFDHETVNDDTYDDPFDFKEEKIKDFKILIDELDLPESSDFLPFPEFDLVFYEDFSEVDALSSTNNEDKDFNPPLYELPFHKEVPGLRALFSFSSENEEKVFNPGILTSKRVHTSLLPELSHRGTKAFKVTKILESPVEIFPCSYQEDIRVLDVLKRIFEKRDKTEHEMEEREKTKSNQSQSPRKSKSKSTWKSQRWKWNCVDQPCSGRVPTLERRKGELGMVVRKWSSGGMEGTTGGGEGGRKFRGEEGKGGGRCVKGGKEIMGSNGGENGKGRWVRKGETLRKGAIWELSKNLSNIVGEKWVRGGVMDGGEEKDGGVKAFGVGGRKGKSQSQP
ncbi:reverse transcriptase domain-containing protein [Tanacetum coccineum]